MFKKIVLAITGLGVAGVISSFLTSPTIVQAPVSVPAVQPTVIPAPEPSKATAQQELPQTKTLPDLDPNKYAIPVNAGGGVETPKITPYKFEETKPYESQPPTVTYPPKDDCHVSLTC